MGEERGVNVVRLLGLTVDVLLRVVLVVNEWRGCMVCQAAMCRKEGEKLGSQVP
jgi:hypothetical protein